VVRAIGRKFLAQLHKATIVQMLDEYNDIAKIDDDIC